MKVVTVRNFRDRATELLRSEELVFITRDGLPAGFFVPWGTPDIPDEVRKAVFLRLAEQIGQARTTLGSTNRRYWTPSLPGAVVADANGILPAVIGGRARLVFAFGPRCVASDVVGNEVRRYLPVLAAKRGLSADRLRLAFAALPVTWHGPDTYMAYEANARRLMASGDEVDWPTLALALSLSLPVWSQDRDFSVGGVKVYGTGELLDLLQENDLM